MLVATAAVPGLAAGQEAVPASYYGSVTVNGEPADPGTEIEAVVDGTTYDTITVEEAGTFGGSGPFEEKLTVEEPDSGDTVKYRVGDVVADTTVTWEEGDVREVDLAFVGVADDVEGGDDEDSSNGGGGSDGGDGASSGGGGTGGGGGGGGGAPADDSTEPSSDSAVQSTEASITTSEGEGAKATFDADSSVESITFESDDMQGTVEVTTQESEPSDIEPSPGTAVQVSEITVPDDATDTPATVRMQVSADRLDEVDVAAEELRVTRLSGGEWENLDTTVAEETESGIVLEAETPGFSYFAVNAMSEPEAVAAVDAGTVTTGEEVTLDGSDSSVEHGEIVNYEWSVAGQSLSGETASATLVESGEYTVELTVTTDAGETDTATATLVVESPADEGSNEPTESDEPAEEPAALGLPAIGGLLAVVAIAVVAVAVGRRRRSNENDPLH